VIEEVVRARSFRNGSGRGWDGCVSQEPVPGFRDVGLVLRSSGSQK
jgi:hypothetical protein